MLTDESIRAILRLENDAQVAAQQLVDGAKDAGGEDNVTVLVINIANSQPMRDSTG